MTITLPRSVADTIEAVRQTERCDMLDRFCVEAVALGRGDTDTIDWIESHYWDYGKAILRGYEVKQE